MTYTVTVRHHGHLVFKVQCSQANLVETQALANRLYPTLKMTTTCCVFEDISVPRSAEEEHIERSFQTQIKTPVESKKYGIETLLRLN